MNTPEKSLASLIQQPSELLHHIVTKSQCLIHLTNLLHQSLEENVAKHCKVANFREETLVLEIDSAAWATQIRYRIPELLMKLRQKNEFNDLKKIEYYIQLLATPHAQSKSTRGLSASSAAVLLETAETLPETDLKQALLRLAKNIKK